MRIGIGFDAHRLAAGRTLVLGGVEIEFERGLEGHSDGDVAVHALVDALLGAAGLGDIGTLFPASKVPRGASSIGMLEEAVRRVRGAGFRIENVDLVVIAERPALDPHRQAVRSRLAAAMGIGEDLVSVKATSTDGMGFTGRGEGMAATAAALLSIQRNNSNLS